MSIPTDRSNDRSAPPARSRDDRPEREGLDESSSARASRETGGELDDEELDDEDLDDDSMEELDEDDLKDMEGPDA